MDVGVRATQGAVAEQSDAAIYNALVSIRKIAALRLLPWMACMLKKHRYRDVT